jgi:hypothetical protein
MARKSRRARRRAAVRESATAATRPTTREGAAVDADRPVARPAAEFTEQYAHVYGDLKRIAIMAGTLLAVLVLLSFLIR